MPSKHGLLRFVHPELFVNCIKTSCGEKEKQDAAHKIILTGVGLPFLYGMWGTKQGALNRSGKLGDKNCRKSGYRGNAYREKLFIGLF